MALMAKALAPGADAVSIGTAAMIALGDNDPKWEEEYNVLGTNREHTTIGKRAKTRRNYDPRSGSEIRLDPIVGGRRLANY